MSHGAYKRLPTRLTGPLLKNISAVDGVDISTYPMILDTSRLFRVWSINMSLKLYAEKICSKDCGIGYYICDISAKSSLILH